MKPTVAILDYGIGNVRSVAAAIEFHEASVSLTSDRQKVLASSHLIIPGVGAFGQGMHHFKEHNLPELVSEFLKSGKPVLGICLGMQLALEVGDEFGTHAGLGIVNGQVLKLPRPTEEARLPNIGWRPIRVSEECTASSAKIFSNLKEQRPKFYFVHSYAPANVPKENIAAWSVYEGTEFIAAIARDNYVGVQFHPEKSSNVGLTLLRNFLIRD